MFRRTIAILLLCCCSSASAEIKHQSKTVNLAPGLFEVKASVEEGADPDITWRAEYRVSVTLPDGRTAEARDPRVVDFRTYERGKYFVAYLEPGQVMSVTSHKIYYDQKLQVITDYRIVATGVQPPVPPGPPSPPSPSVPESVSDAYGVGHETYRQAVAVGDKATAARLAEQTAAVYWGLHRGQCTGTDADAQVKAALDSLPAPWSDFATKVKAAYLASQAAHGAGMVPLKSIIREMSHALTEAAK
jgi:hypothetical protein